MEFNSSELSARRNSGTIIKCDLRGGAKRRESAWHAAVKTIIWARMARSSVRKDEES